MAGRQGGRRPARGRVEPRGEQGGLTRRGILLALLSLSVAAALAFGVVSWVADDQPKHALEGTEPPPSGPGLDLTPPPAAPAVLEPLSGQPRLSVERLRRHLAGALALPGLGGRLGFAVAQLGDPTVAWSAGARVVTPASTMKLLTTSAALATLGPSHRFTTSVVQGAGRASIVLVGGGDPLLTATTPTASQAPDLSPRPASLLRLAEDVARRLTGEGVRRVRLGYDASLFTGPAVNPRWPSTYISENVVSPISALWVDEGREQPGLALRSPDPAQHAAEVFETLLAKAGVKVVGPVQAQQQPRPQTPAKVLASVTSPPLEQIVGHILEVSDNEGAEVLLRQVAVAAGSPGSSQAGVTAVRRALTRLGLDLDGARFYDGSGLSRDDRLPVQLLIRVIETAASPSHPALHGVIAGLPVAGFSGSLGYRFDDAQAGLGYVRAKTGTLTGVHGLAGLAITRRGQALAFVAVANRVTAADPARADLDKIAAALSTCRC